MTEFTLNVFTLNCWGIPVVSKNRKERMEAICTYLQESSHELVCLQEVWSEEDYLFFKKNLWYKLPYSHYFYSGVLGSGLCVFSEWTIQDVFFHQWPLNGYIHKIHHGDWFGGKGIGLCRIRVEDKLINIYCTHLHAEYHERDIYLAHRVLQAHSTAEFVKLTSATADISILAGDLNTGPGDLAYRLITEVPALTDPYDLNCQNTNPTIRPPSGTCENANNSYTVKRTCRCPDGKRIDHILFYHTSQWKADVINFGNPLEDRVPGQPYSYSDHNAVTLELRLRSSDSNSNERQESLEDRSLDNLIDLAQKACQESVCSVTKAKNVYFFTGMLLFWFLLAFVDCWPSLFFFNVIKLGMSALCFYYLVMGTLWSRMEMNSLKAGLSAFDNFRRTRGQQRHRAFPLMPDR